MARFDPLPPRAANARVGQMGILRTLLKWTGITIGIAFVSIIGFVVAAWLSPGDPGRSYAVAAISLGVAAVIFRFLFPEGDEPSVPS